MLKTFEKLRLANSMTFKQEFVSEEDFNKSSLAEHMTYREFYYYSLGRDTGFTIKWLEYPKDMHKHPYDVTYGQKLHKMPVDLTA